MMFPCERCGWMPEDCPCAANRVTFDDLDRRHAKAVERAKPTPPDAPPRPVVLSEWARGSWGHTVAHRFRDDDGRSLCGLTSARAHGDVRAVAGVARCKACVRALDAAATRLAVAA